MKDLNETNSPPRLKTKTYTGELKANKSRKQKTTELNGRLRNLTELNGKERMTETQENIKRHAVTRCKTNAGLRRTKTASCFFQTYRWLDRAEHEVRANLTAKRYQQ